MNIFIKILFMLFTSFVAVATSYILTKKLINKYPEYDKATKYLIAISIIAFMINAFLQYKINFYTLNMKSPVFDYLLFSILSSFMSGCLSSSFMIDFLFEELPDETNFIIGLLAFPIGLKIFGMKVIVNAILIFLIFLFVALLTGQLGMGDVKLVFFMGLAFKIDMLLSFLTVSFFSASIFCVFKLLFDKSSKRNMIAFGPFLIIGFISILFI